MFYNVIKREKSVQIPSYHGEHTPSEARCVVLVVKPSNPVIYRG